MRRRHTMRGIAGLFMVVGFAGASATTDAQVTRGFDNIARAIANGEERQRQPDLNVFEVQFKPMRIVHVDVTDPKTGEKQRQQVWYLCYRTVNRMLAAREDASDISPVNVLDPLPGPTQFIPELSLIAYDEQGSDQPAQEYLSAIVPEALAVINRVERRRPSDPKYADSVGIVQPVPSPMPADQKDVDWIYGVATFPNVDPDTDFFKVVMRGFSNGYELRPGPDGENVTWRKALVQEFVRRGDRYDPNQIEFELVGSPEWVYLPDPAPAVQ